MPDEDLGFEVDESAEDKQPGEPEVDGPSEDEQTDDPTDPGPVPESLMAEERTGPPPAGEERVLTVHDPNHWVHFMPDMLPPMGHKLGTDNPQYANWLKKVDQAGKWAIQKAGKLNDDNLEALAERLLYNFKIGLLGYPTPTGDPAPIEDDDG